MADRSRRPSRRRPSVPLVGGLHIVAQPSGLEDLEGTARAIGYRPAPTRRLGSIGHGQRPPVITDMTRGRSFDPITIVATGPLSAALIGELDLAGVSTVRATLARFDGDILLDCSGLAFIDAAGLGTLIDAHGRCQTKGTTLVLVNPSRCLLRLLEITNLSTRFNLTFPDT